MRQIRNPGVQESFDKIMDIAKFAKEIIKELKTPEMARTLENFRLISQNMSEVTTKMQESLHKLEETGAINEAKGLIKSAKSAIDVVGAGAEGAINGQDLREMNTVIKEMFKSIRSLVDELRITVAYSKESGTIHTIEETVKDASDIYNIVRHKN